jgi:hypothetical protein
MSNIARRVSQLEDAAGARAELLHVVRIITTDNADDAVERYRADHPDVPANVMFIVHRIVSPQHHEVGP